MNLSSSVKLWDPKTSVDSENMRDDNRDSNSKDYNLLDLTLEFGEYEMQGLFLAHT